MSGAMGEAEGHEPARILVVDDIPANAKLLADLLQLQGYVTRSLHGRAGEVIRS